MLKKVRRWFSALFVLASMLVGFWVYAENPNAVGLTLFGFPLGPQPLGLLVIATFVVGVVLGLFCNILMTSWMVFKLKRLQKQLRDLELKPGKS